MIRPHPFLLRVFSASLSIALLIGCGDSKEIDDDPPERPRLSLQNELPAFGSAGGSAPLTFATNRAWRIDPELQDGDPGGWFEIAPLSGEAGEALSVTVRVDPNEAYTGRGFVLRLCTEPKGTESVLEERIEITQAKKNAILVGDNRRAVGSGQQTLTVEVQSNVDYTVTVKTGGSWIGELPESRAAPGLEARTHRFAVAANPDAQERTGVIVFTDKDSELFDELTVVQAAWEDPDPERSALKALYDAAGGGGWTRSDNWGSDKPLSEWYGVETDAEGRVIGLRLPNNNLSGAILKYVGKLTSLRYVDLSHNALEEDLDYYDEETYKWRSHLDDLLELETLDMSHNRLTQNPPGSWSRLEKLRYIDLSSNNLSGGTPIPIQWEPKYRDGKYIDVILNDNYISGGFNDFVVQHPQWSRIALQFIRQKMRVNGSTGSGGLSFENLFLPDFTFTDLRDGSQRPVREVYSANKLTMLLQWNPLQEESIRFAQTFVERFHTLYGAQGFAVVAIMPEGDEYRQAAERYLQTHEVAWPVVADYADADGKRVILPTEPYPSYLLVDQRGEVIEDMFPEKRIDDPFWVRGNPPTRADLVNRPLEIIDQLNQRFATNYGKSTYRSTDFSMDKRYETLQRATRGKGIDIVLIGEAFTDVDIRTGYYREVMEFAMESFFAMEPAKSYRDYFNVHMVYAVSRNAYIGHFSDDSETALSLWIDNSYQWFDINTAIYNLRNSYTVVPKTEAAFPVYAVVVNNSGGGVTSMDRSGLNPNYSFSGFNARHGFQATFNHETVGHAFGLAGDEYVRLAAEYRREIPESEKRRLQGEQSRGLFLNLSLTNDPSAVGWAHLIGHPRYPEVSLFEGGYYYLKGVWRSEAESTMDRTDAGYFNTFCRELIVRRILELSGEGYTFEKFLEKDKSDRPAYRVPALRRGSVGQDPYMHQPPIVAD